MRPDARSSRRPRSSGSVRDVRGRRLPLTSRLPDPVKLMLDDLTQSRIRRGSTLLVLILTSILLAAGTLWLMLSRWPGLLGGWILFAWPIGGLVIVAAAVAWIVRVRHAALVSHELLRTRHCGACAYDLRGVLPTADGRTICPECGGHWRLPAPR